MPPHTVDAGEADFAAVVLDESHRRPVVVDFWAAWCGPCKVLSPTLEALAAAGNGSWLLAKVDVDHNQALARQFGVQGIPTVVGFRDGQPVGRFTGAGGEAQVRSFIESLLPTELDLVAAEGEQAFDRGDTETAEERFRSVLGQDPSHEAAGLGLATILLDRDMGAEALDVLGRLPRSSEVRRMEAAARLWGGPQQLEELAAAATSGSDADRLAYAKALSVGGDVATSMEILLELVADRGDHADEARATIVDLFEVLGSDHPLVPEYRRKLASALF